MSQNIDELYLLVQSMSPNQKRMFTRYCKLSKDESNSLVLFNGLKKLKEYDRKKLEKFLKKNNREKTIENLTTEVILLFKLLLKAISFMTDTHSVEITLKNQIKYTKFLYEKGMFGKAKRMMKKLEKDATEYDLKIVLLELYKYKHIIKLGIDGKKYAESIDEMHEKEQKLLAAINLEQQLRYIYSKALILAQEISILDKNEAHTRLIEIETALSKIYKAQCNCFGTKIFHLSAMAKLYELKSDEEAIFNCMQEIEQVYKTYPSASKISDFRYIKHLVNHLHYLIKYDQASNQILETLVQLENIKVKGFREEIIKFSDFRYLEFVYWLKQGNFTKLDQLAPKLEEGLEKYNTQIELGRKVTIWSNLMIYYFIKQDFNSVHALIQKILTEGKGSRRKDIFNKAKFLELLVHFEQDNTSIFKSQITKVERSCIDEDNPKKTAALAKFVCKLMNRHYAKAPLTRADFEEALPVFDNIDRTKNKKMPYDVIEIWLRSKIRRVPMQIIAVQMFGNG